MVDIRQSANDYVKKSTKNISELAEIPVDGIEVKEEEGINSDGKNFSYKYIEVEGERYRIPATVIEQLQTLLDENPAIKKFKVKKKGEGLQTSYQVIAL